MKIKTLTFGIFAALLLTACGNKANESETEAKTSNSDQWQEIKPQNIDVNAVKLFANDWMLLSAGNDTSMNMMTIAWGALGELWGKPIVTVYVSTDRYTYKFLEDNEYFTVTAFPEQFRDKLQYIGSVSGRDEDKVKGSGLTPEFTKLGNPIYKEANLAIECKKIYAEQLKKELMPLEQRQWYDEKKLGVHMMYIGEIVNVWKK